MHNLNKIYAEYVNHVSCEKDFKSVVSIIFSNKQIVRKSQSAAEYPICKSKFLTLLVGVKQAVDTTYIPYFSAQ